MLTKSSQDFQSLKYFKCPLIKFQEPISFMEAMIDLDQSQKWESELDQKKIYQLYERIIVNIVSAKLH